MTEWDEDVYVMMTRLEDGAFWDTSNSGMYNKETYYLSREAKEGDIAGRVPANLGVTWKVLFLNYDEEGK